MPISEQVLAILEDISEYGAIGQDLDLQLYDQHILDSLKTVELLIAFSEAFGVEIAPTAFEPAQWATPRRMIGYFELLVGERTVAV